MAILYIREYIRQGRDTNGQFVSSGEEPALADQTVAIGAGSLPSNAFNAKTAFVRIHTDAICSILFGTNPTATAVNARLAANTTEYFAVVPGSGEKVAVIQNT